MHLEMLVEEVSAEAALCLLLPRIVGAEVTVDIHAFQGKRDLLAKLPDRLKGYARWKTVAAAGEPFVVLNRLAMEELEAWFFGDCDAITGIRALVSV